MKAGRTAGNWTFWSVGEGLTAAVHDVSADEAGNVYVAARQAVFAKTRGDTAFKRFDATNAGLSETCYFDDAAFDDLSLVDKYLNVVAPTIPIRMCPAISVAGSSAGKAVVGYRGAGTDQDKDALSCPAGGGFCTSWALFSGGADVVTFDGTNLSRERRVLVAGPPGTVCESHDAAGYCLSMGWGDGVYLMGRLKTRQVERIAINRKAGRGQYDAIMGGTHGAFTVLVANPQARGWRDEEFTQNPVAKLQPKWADAKYVFEHQHPAFDPNDPTGAIHTGETFAIAVDPRSGLPWFSNDWRTTNMPGYVKMAIPYNDPRVYEPYWGDMTAAATAFISFFDAGYYDAVQSMSFCDDGTLWVGSLHGLARATVDPNSGSLLGVQQFRLPAPFDGPITAVACDPSDGSVWIGPQDGGIVRLKSGTFTSGSNLLPGTAPEFATKATVRNIQIDRWATPRTVYFAHLPYKDTTGATKPGGVTSYSGP